MLYLILLLLAIVLTTLAFLIRKTNIGKFPWFQFFLKGKESGFTFREINLLRKVAIENSLKDPISLFWSVKQLDYSIKGTIIKYRASGEESSDSATNFICKLFDFRKRVEFELPKYKLGLKTTREIADRQRIKLSTPGIGPFYSIIVENLRRYLALSYPQGQKVPQGFSWKGQQISVYFWRTGDAGYFFSSKVIDDFSEQKYPIIHVAHSGNLIRTQKRKSIRAELNNNAILFPLKSSHEANEIVETGRGLRCRMLDISEDGAAILIGGKAKVGIPIKVQFELAENMIMLNGIVKGINYEEAKNRSILHIQAFTPSNSMKNRILAYVYNIFGDRTRGEARRSREKKQSDE